MTCSFPFSSSRCRWSILVIVILFIITDILVGVVTTCTAADVPTGAQQATTKNSYSSIEEDFDYDENDKLAKYYMVFPANKPNCRIAADMKPDDGFDFAEVEGDALQRIFPDYVPDGTDRRCLAACLEKGTDKSLTGYTMPYLHFESPGPLLTAIDKQLFDEWYLKPCRRQEVCFINYQSRRPLHMYWIPPEQVNSPRDDNLDNKRPQAELVYGERKTHCFFSYIGHVFDVYGFDAEGGIDFYERIVVGHTSTRAFGTSPPSSSQKINDLHTLEQRIKGALTTEWSKHFDVKRTFSSLGFSKGRLPNDVFASMGAFYYNNRHNVVNEEWEGKGFFVNWWEADVKFVPIPWKLKEMWQLRLATLVSAWSGVEVEQTSMYGLRQYEGGARLLSHVDRKPTHAVSLIVNVAQDNLANPWPVEVFDHADRLHEVTMVPGDIIYYESAKNLHSRNRPLTCREGGCSFVNLFTHYRPADDGDQWFNNFDDMPNRPPPLLDGQVSSDQDNTICTLSSDSKGDEGRIGVGTVDCHDSRLGSYISPTLYKASSAQHLFQWWKATKDPNFIGYGYAKEMHGINDDDDDGGSPSLQNSEATKTNTGSDEL